MKRSTWIFAISFLLAAVGFLWPFWPLAAAGILLAALAGRPYVALALGLLLDIAYGAPLGHWHFLYVPFTLLAALAVCARYFGARYLRRDSASGPV